MIQDVPPEPFSLPAFARNIVLDGIKRTNCPTEMKQRIMLARECGFLDDEETEDWIAMVGVKHD